MNFSLYRNNNKEIFPISKSFNCELLYSNLNNGYIGCNQYLLQYNVYIIIINRLMKKIMKLNMKKYLKMIILLLQLII